MQRLNLWHNLTYGSRTTLAALFKDREGWGQRKARLMRKLLQQSRQETKETQARVIGRREIAGRGQILDIFGKWNQQVFS